MCSRATWTKYAPLAVSLSFRSFVSAEARCGLTRTRPEFVFMLLHAEFRTSCSFSIFSLALEFNHLENVWSGSAAISELYFARLQNDSPTVQDCHWYMFCPVSPWTQCHIHVQQQAVESSKQQESAALTRVCRNKRLFTDCRHSLHEIYCLYDTHLTVKWLKTALYCTYNKSSEYTPLTEKKSKRLWCFFVNNSHR